MFNPRLWLQCGPNGKYSLLVKTPVPDSRYTAGEALVGTPPDMHLGKHVYPIRLYLDYQDSEDQRIPGEVQHRIAVNLADGDVLTVFVLHKDDLLGSAETIIGITPIDGTLVAMSFLKSEFALPPPVLTPAFCQSMIVLAAPKPENFSSSAQPLQQLGIMDAICAENHREAICRQMKSIGHEILPDSIKSGPEITISDSRDSLISNSQPTLRSNQITSIS